MSGWISLAIIFLRVAGDILAFIEREQAQSDAERRIIRELKEQADASIAKAEAVRAGVRADLDANPDSLRDDSRGPWRD